MNLALLGPLISGLHLLTCKWSLQPSVLLAPQRGAGGTVGNEGCNECHALQDPMHKCDKECAMTAGH